MVQRKRATLRCQDLERRKRRRPSKRHPPEPTKVEAKRHRRLLMPSDKAQRGAPARVREGVVLETGASHVRLGTTAMYTDAVPTIARHPNAIGRTRAGVRRQVLVGDEIEDHCLDYGGLQLRTPIERGMVVDWAAQKAVWDRALARRYGIPGKPYDSFGALAGKTVIVTEPYFALPEQQRAIDMLMFEWYQADAIWRTIRTSPY